jgi:hypothetical protein
VVTAEQVTPDRIEIALMPTAIAVGTSNSAWAIWQATMFTSSASHGDDHVGVADSAASAHRDARQPSMALTSNAC